MNRAEQDGLVKQLDLLKVGGILSQPKAVIIHKRKLFVVILTFALKLKSSSGRLMQTETTRPQLETIITLIAVSAG